MNNLKELDSSNLFLEQNAQGGLATAAEISKDVHSFTEEEVNHVSLLLFWCASGYRFIFSPLPKRDRFGSPYLWVGRGSSNASTGMKVPARSWISKLMDLALEGVKVNLSLDEMMTVAESLIKKEAKNQTEESVDTSTSSLKGNYSN